MGVSFMSEAPGTPKKKRFPVTLDFSSTNVSKHNDVLGMKKPVVGQGINRATPQVSARAASVKPVPSLSPVSTSATDALRMRMVDRLRAQGIQSYLVLQAMSRVPRHHFVDTALKNQAYEDTSLPIGLEQTISKPSVVATMLDYIMPANGQFLRNVLDIGTGCGYQASVLSLLSEKVYSIERLKGLHERARTNLRPLALKNVHLIYGDGSLGFPTGAPYDAIIVAATGQEIPVAWLEQMSVGGILIAPVEIEQRQQVLVKIVRTAQGWEKMLLEAVQFVPLKSGTS